MKKILKHLKSNGAIYLVLIACIIVILIAVLYKPKDALQEVDTEYFEIVNIDRAIKLFDDSETKMLIMSTNTCQTTVKYVGYVKYSMITNGYKPYFLYLEDIKGKDKAKLDTLGELLDTDYTYEGVTKPLIDYVKEGVTPITVLIKNKKLIYAFIGSMNTSTLDSLAQAYGLGDKSMYGLGDDEDA